MKELDKPNNEEESFKNTQAALAGAAMNSWLPIGNGRKAIVFVLLALGLYGFITENNEMLIYFPIAALFSPRIVGTAAYAAGCVVRVIKGR